MQRAVDTNPNLQLLPRLYRCRLGCMLLALVSMVTIGCDRTKPESVAGKSEDTNAKTGAEETGKLALQAATPATDGATQAGTQPAANAAMPDYPVNAADAAGAGAVEMRVEDPASSATRVISDTDLSKSTFMTLKPPTSQQPADLVAFLGQVDVALRDLIIAGSNNIVDSAIFTERGMRLGKMKLEAGEQLANSPDSTDEQRKSATIAQLVALSHMSGLKDVESAKKLEKFASTLMQSSDADLAHQGRVVWLGFRLQDLQNGVNANPESLLTDLQSLFQRPEDSGFPEMMILQQAQQVLEQMGFNDAANKVDDIVVDKYMNAADVQLSLTAWGIAVTKSQSFANYNAALQDVYTGKMTEPALFLGAVRGLFQELPNATTLLQYTNAATDLEYRGTVEIASELGNFVRERLAAMPESSYKAGMLTSLDAQQRRLSLRGQTLELAGLIDMDGKPLDWSAYRGKVVLLDFWATWCTPCLREIPNIRKVYDAQKASGFEVIGINMDDNLTPLEQYLTSNPLPWKTTRSADSAALGFKSAIAQQLGITAIPFLVLVDGEGKVAAIHVRGDRLGPTVQAMLSPTFGQ